LLQNQTPKSRLIFSKWFLYTKDIDNFSKNMNEEASPVEHGNEISPAEQAEIAARLDAFAANAQEIKSGLLPVANAQEVMSVVQSARDSAPDVLLSMHEKKMVSLSENGDPSARMVEYDSMMMALNDIRQKEADAIADESGYSYVEIDLGDYSSEVPQYILDRIANLPRFQKPIQ